jgi:uncharacterized protein YbjT (DUF2867 family)
MPIIAVAGATGRLGQLIVRALLDGGAEVRALVRPDTAPDKLAGLSGATIVPVDFGDPAALTQALTGADGVVSALNGLRDIIVDLQTDLLNAAVAAGVPRFIPSDYAADLTKLEPGENRNFDLRREFRVRLLAAPIRSTSVLNGGFMELLLWGRALDMKAHTVSYFGSPDQPLDYTTTPDVAAFTAAAALDPDAPEILRVVGDVVTMREIAAIAGELSGVPYALVRLGSIEELAAMIVAERAAHPEAETETFPRFQHLQYTHNMQSGRGRLTPLDNARYPIKTTKVRDLLAGALQRAKEPQ